MAKSPTNSNNNHLISYKGVLALRASHPEVRKIKRTQDGHSAHGNKVWRSSFVLMDYLNTYPVAENARVLDIGCGWGLTGIYLAKKFGADVTGIDLDENVEPFLKLQARLNDCEVAFQRRSFESLKKSDLARFDTLIGTDICFWDEMTKPLFKLIRRARKAGVQRVLIADPGRPPFWELADRCAEKLDSEVITRRLSRPWKTEKHILVVESQE